MALTKVTGDFIKAGSITQGHLHSSHGITTSHIAEGNKLFFTNARVDSRVGSLSTSNLSEGTNLYYTNARADARIALQVGSNLDLSSKSTSDLSEGTNLYYTQARFNTAFTAKSTSDLSEGTNLYYTNARADARIAAASTSDLSEGTNLYYTDARADARITAADTDSLSEGSTNLYYTDARADARVALIVDSAPSTLDTLNELAAALGDDANFSTTVTNSIATKLPLAGGTLTGALSGTSATFSGIGQFAGAIRITETGTAQHILIGNQDSAGANKPAMIRSANASLEFGYGNSWSGEGGTMTTTLQLHANSNASFAGNATFTGTITASGYNDSNWNTAYGWGNHASAGYFTNSGSWLGDLGSNGYTRENGLTMTGGSEFVVLSKSGQGSVLVDGHYMAYESNNGFFGTFNSTYGNLTGIRASAANTLKVMQLDGGNAILLVTQDVRAPLYYDSNDTVYYVNPASRSNFGDLDLNSGAVWDATTQGTGKGSLHIDPNSGADHAGGAITFGASDHNNGQSSDAGIYVRSDGNYGTKMYFSTTDSYAAGSKTAMNILQNGQVNITRNNLIVNTDVRAPLFYDSNDTTYYVDPGSTGTSAKFRQFVNIGDSSSYSSNSGTWGARLNVVDNVHARIDVGQDANSMLSTWYAHTGNSGPIFGSMTAHPLRLMYNGSEVGFWNSSQLYHASSVRSPIFYDSNNTAYYANPNGFSSLWGVAIRGDNDADGTENQIFFYGSGGTTTSAIGFKNGGSFANPTGNGDGWNTMLTMDTDGRGWVFRRGTGGTNFTSAYTAGWILNNGIFQANASMRAPIFYDSNDTGFYLNPASQSRLGSLKLDGIISGAASGCAEYGRNHAYHTPEIKGYGAEFMIGAQHTEININYRTCNNGASGHTPTTWKWRAGASNNWSDHYMGLIQSSSSMRAPIFYDSTDTGYYLHPNSTSVLSLVNHQVGVGVNQTGSQTTAHGVSLYGTYTGGVPTYGMMFTGTSGQGTHGAVTNAWATFFTMNNDDSRGWIFKKVGGTNSASISAGGVATFDGSVISPIHSGTISTTGDGQNNYPFRLGSDYNSYMMATAGNTWGLFWAGNSGARYGTNGNGGPGNIWSNSTNPNEFAFVGSDSTAWTVHGTTGNVWLKGYGTAANSYRAPIFYDSNDTNHYLDPASTSVVNTLRFSGSSNNGRFDADEWGVRFKTDAGYILFGPANTGHAHIYTDRSNFYFNQQIQLNGGSLINTNDIRAQIFYDLNDTNYYCDPNGTSYVKYLGRREHQSGHFVGSYNNIGGNSAKSNPIYTIGSNYNPNETTLADMYGIGYAHPNLWGSGKTSDWGFYVANNGSVDATIGDGSVTAWFASQVHAAGDFRAPIFYDLDNTGYYLNPASTSNVNAMNFAGIIDANGGHGGINITNTSILSSASSNWTGNPGGAGKIQYHSNRWYIVSDSSSNRIVQFRKDGSDKSYIDNDGRLIGAPDARAPIFYDSDNTAYYGDFASTTRVNLISCAGGLTFPDNYGIGVTGLYTSTRIQTIFNMGAAYKLPNNGASTGSAYGLYWSHQNAGSVGGANNLASHGIIILENGSYKGSWGGGRLVTPSDIRGTLFYDYQNTAYYVNPDSTSNIVNLTVANTITGAITRTAGTSGYGHAGTGMWPFYNWGGSNGGGSAPTTSSYTTGISIGSHPGDQAYGWQMANNMWNAGIWYRTYNSGFSSWYKLLDNTTNTQTINSSLYVNNDIGIGFTSGAIGGKVNIQINSANGIGVKNNINGKSGATGILQYTSASYASGGYNMVFQAAPPSGTDVNMLLCYLNGNLVNRFNSYGQYSDRKLKENIVDTTPKLEDVKRIRIRNFNFKDDPYKQIGVIAQEFEEVFPGLVEDKEVPDQDETTKTVKYSVLVPILVKAMQEQQTIIDDLKSRLETLENQ